MQPRMIKHGKTSMISVIDRSCNKVCLIDFSNFHAKFLDSSKGGVKVLSLPKLYSRKSCLSNA